MKSIGYTYINTERKKERKDQISHENLGLNKFKKEKNILPKATKEIHPHYLHK